MSWVLTARLCLCSRIEWTVPGYEADLCVLDLAVTPLLGFRTGTPRPSRI